MACSRFADSANWACRSATRRGGISAAERRPNTARGGSPWFGSPPRAQPRRGDRTVVDDHTPRRPNRAPRVRCLISPIMMMLSSVAPDSVAPPGLGTLVTLGDLGLPPQALFARPSGAELHRRFADPANWACRSATRRGGIPAAERRPNKARGGSPWFGSPPCAQPRRGDRMVVDNHTPRRPNRARCVRCLIS